MHAVNLRSAWEASAAGSDEPPLRVHLPRDWSEAAWPGGVPPERFRLVRRFGRPARLDAGVEVSLRLGGFLGLEAVTLNGEPASYREEGGFVVVGPFRPLPRNVLTIEVDLPRAAGAGAGWGRAAYLDIPPP